MLDVFLDTMMGVQHELPTSTQRPKNATMYTLMRRLLQL